MTPVVSDNIRYLGYDYSTQILRVTFHDGRTYEFNGLLSTCTK